MFKTSALALLGAMAFTTAAQIHPPTPAGSTFGHAVHSVVGERETGRETFAVYYSPLNSTTAVGYLGLGMAYHMAIVYTDAAGRSYGVSSGPSNLSAAPTPAHAFSALFDMANNAPSSFGTLVSDPHNNTPFIKGTPADYYTQNREGQAYPHTTVLKGRDLADRWTAIVQTYEHVGQLRMSYSPVSQNSNSLAGTALRRAGVTLAFSHQDVFAPGLFTLLP